MFNNIGPTGLILIAVVCLAEIAMFWLVRGLAFGFDPASERFAVAVELSRISFPYLALISLSTAMILVPYLFSAVYGLRTAWRDEGDQPAGATKRGPLDVPVAALASIYCLWLLYAAGPKYLLLSAVLYAPGAGWPPFSTTAPLPSPSLPWHDTQKFS